MHFYSRAAAGERHGSVSEADSDEENEEGDYTVYECPGLAPVSKIFILNKILMELKIVLYLRFLSLYNCHVCPSFLCPPIVPTNLTNLLLATFLAFIRLSVMAMRVLVLIFITLVKIKIKQQNSCCLKI
jgi:hypothetical protein